MVLVLRITNGDEPDERRKQIVEENSRANNERLLRPANEIRRSPTN